MHTRTYSAGNLIFIWALQESSLLVFLSSPYTKQQKLTLEFTLTFGLSLDCMTYMADTKRHVFGTCQLVHVKNFKNKYTYWSSTLIHVSVNVFVFIPQKIHLNPYFFLSDPKLKLFGIL